MGISRRPGPHHLSQKVTITAFFPRKSAMDTGRPSKPARVTCGAGLFRRSTVLPAREMPASSNLARQVMKIVKAASAINAAIAPVDGFVSGAVATDLARQWIISARPDALSPPWPVTSFSGWPCGAGASTPFFKIARSINRTCFTALGLRCRSERLPAVGIVLIGEEMPEICCPAPAPFEARIERLRRQYFRSIFCDCPDWLLGER